MVTDFKTNPFIQRTFIPDRMSQPDEASEQAAILGKSVGGCGADSCLMDLVTEGKA